MAKDKRAVLSQIFLAMMMYSGLVWVWTVAFILGWPWQPATEWKPEYRLAAVCVDKEPCGVAYGELGEAVASGRLLSLVPADASGEINEPQNWLRWQTPAGKPWQYEVTTSSWYFQTGIRYRVEGNSPVLVAVQEIGGNTLYYGMGGALLTLILIYARRFLRK